MQILIDSIDKRMTVPLIDDLAAAGYDVHGLCFKGTTPLNAGKLKAIHVIDRERAASQLYELFSRYGADDILIAGNPTVIDVVNNIRPAVKYLLPSGESIRQAGDKKALMDLAQRLGIKTPRVLDTPKFPMIAKLNVSENTALKPAERYRIIGDRQAYAATRPFMEKHRGNLILQEYVDGVSRGVTMLLDEKSNLVDFIVHERLLEYPVSGGPSAACRTVIAPQLAEAAYKLLRALNWRGLAMVEFKGDTLIEINPRFWGSMPLVFTAGSKFFSNYVKVCRNTHQTITTAQVLYRPDKIMVYFPQGLMSVLRLFTAGHFKKAVVGLGVLLRGHEGILRLRNPRPFFRYLRTLWQRK